MIPAVHERYEGDIEVIEPADAANVLLLADHAGNRIPPELGRLGLPADALERHIAYDIGVATLTRQLSAALAAPAILDHCSRLVIDPNRRPGTPTSVPAVSDATVVPGNQNLAPAELDRRIQHYHLPYHRAIARRLAAFRRAGRVPVIVAIHSFTPRLADGLPRPWQVGVLWRGDRRIAGPVLEALQRRGDLAVGDNQPYSGHDEFGYTIEFHAQRGRLPHVMFEFRQDEVADPATARRYAELTAAALAPVLATPQLYARWDGPLRQDSPWRHPSGLIQPG